VGGAVAVIGEETLVRGFAMAGALVFAADEPATVREAWQSLPPPVEVVILTAAAARALAIEDRGADLPLVAVMDGEAVP
jgi:vacuolar-type H+-ATPase subunit F/Vma7